MLPSANQDRQQGGGGRSNQKTSNRLRAEDLSANQKEDAKVLGVKADPDGRYGAQVIVKLAIKGGVKFWYLDIKKNPNYKILVEKFGQDENNWIDARLQFDLEQDNFSDNWFIRVHFPEAAKARSGR